VTENIDLDDLWTAEAMKDISMITLSYQQLYADLHHPFQLKFVGLFVRLQPPIEVLKSY
jgi:hypothetical protein